MEIAEYHIMYIIYYDSEKVGEQGNDNQNSRNFEMYC